MKHLSWTYPIVCQTEKEDFIAIGKDAAGGDIIPVKNSTKMNIIKNIWRQDVHAHGRGFPFPELASFFAKKSVYSPHNDTIGTKPFTRLIRRVIINRYDKIITQTEYGKNNLIKNGINRNKIEVIPSAVDYEVFSKTQGGNGFRKKYNISSPFALAIGIRAVKNPLVIARACEKAGINVVMLGPKKKQAVKAAWKDTGFDWYLPPSELFEFENVLLPGQLTLKETLAAMDAATMFINSSEYECFCLAAYEAAASGLPLCLPNYGTFDIFKESALFHKKNDPRDLSKNIKRYLDNPNLRNHNGRKSKIIARKFDYPIIKQRYKDMYRTVGMF